MGNCKDCTDCHCPPGFSDCGCSDGDCQEGNKGYSNVNYVEIPLGVPINENCGVTPKSPAKKRFAVGDRVVALGTKEHGVVEVVRWTDVGVHRDGTENRIITFFPHQHLIKEEDFQE